VLFYPVCQGKLGGYCSFGFGRSWFRLPCAAKLPEYELPDAVMLASLQRVRPGRCMSNAKRPHDGRVHHPNDRRVRRQLHATSEHSCTLGLLMHLKLLECRQRHSAALGRV
jgi:hypothetical protein